MSYGKNIYKWKMGHLLFIVITLRLLLLDHMNYITVFINLLLLITYWKKE